LEEDHRSGAKAGSILASGWHDGRECGKTGRTSEEIRPSAAKAAVELSELDVRAKARTLQNTGFPRAKAELILASGWHGGSGCGKSGGKSEEIYPSAAKAAVEID
jgi:hypothetical protein